MRVIDVFPFADEFDIAFIRLSYLSSFVDYFFVGEFDTTFSGLEKEYNFEKLLASIPKNVRDKVIYAKFRQKLISKNAFDNDDYQKRILSMEVGKSFAPNDIAIVGDCDEIPSLQAIKKTLALDMFTTSRLGYFAQRLFMGYLNYEDVSGIFLSAAGEFHDVRKRQWLGTVLTDIQTLAKLHFSGIRAPLNLDGCFRIPKGGWHFSYCNGKGLSFEDRFISKTKATAHQEFNTLTILQQAKSRIENFQDPLDRKYKSSRSVFSKKPKFRKTKIDASYPEWLVQNIHMFENLVL